MFEKANMESATPSSMLKGVGDHLKVLANKSNTTQGSKQVRNPL